MDKESLPKVIKDLNKFNFDFRPVQKLSLKKGLFENSKNQLVVSPTGSGKTLIGEFGILKSILIEKKKAIYIVPLKALASQIYEEFENKYEDKIILKKSSGEIQKEERYKNYDLLITTVEKFDSFLRKDTSFLKKIGVIVIDEIHLLNDETRGPTLEIILSCILSKFKEIRIIGLSATIKNSQELADWLKADLIENDFRPTVLEHKILHDNHLLKIK